MAVTFVQSIGTGTPASSSTPAMTTSATAVVGERIVFAVGWFNAAVTLSSVADSAGNTWAVDVQHEQSSVHSALASAHVTSQLTSGGTITATFSASADWLAMGAMTFSDVASSSYSDGTGTYGDAGTGASSWNTSDTTTTVADAVIVGVDAQRGPTDFAHTAGTSQTEVHELWRANTNLATVYRILSSTGTYDASGSWSGTDFGGVAAVHQVYKGTGGGGGPAPTLRTVQSNLRWGN
jgi:hypothetical protein